MHGKKMLPQGEDGLGEKMIPQGKDGVKKKMLLQGENGCIGFAKKRMGP
jgi:hypothetical protein